MNDDYIEVRALDQSRIEGLKAWGWVSYLLHLVVAVAAVVPGAQPSIALLVIALIIDQCDHQQRNAGDRTDHRSGQARRRRRQLDGQSLLVAHPQRDLG